MAIQRTIPLSKNDRSEILPFDTSYLPDYPEATGVNVLCVGKKNATVLVVCDSPSKSAFEMKKVMGDAPMSRFWETAQMRGMTPETTAFITPCPNMTELVAGSAARETAFLEEFREEFKKALSQFRPKCVVHLGVVSGRQLTGKPMQITKVRGQVKHYPNVFGGNVPVMGMLSPGQLLRQPGYAEQFMVDFDSLRRLKRHGWDAHKAELSARQTVYKWVDSFDLALAWENSSGAASWDTETTGGKWIEGAVPLTVAFCFEPGVSHVTIVHKTYMLRHWEEQRGKPFTSAELKAQAPRAAEHAAKNMKCVKHILEHPQCFYSGHNLKYDLHIMKNVGVKVRTENWLHDTMQLAFAANENITSKDLANCTKLWVPVMGGYSDEFDSTTDKGHMIDVPPSVMLPYAAGDSDAVARLTTNLLELVDEDPKQSNCYERVQMPALRMFVDVERTGIAIDKPALREFSTALEVEESKTYDWLISKVHKDIRLAHMGKKGDGLKFSRAAFLIDILFKHPKGFRLKPQVWTDGTKHLPMDQRVPSTSSNVHLPFFEDNTWVATLMQYQEYAKMRSTYAGQEFDNKKECPTGIWQYITPAGRIHPSYWLHRTVTGRVASSDPNGQNFPKRGELAKAFRRIFVPSEGCVFIEADLSQAELRVAAWMAMESTMIKLYREGADIHAATAAAVKGLSLEAFMKLPEKEIELYRQQAKAVNFGFLYGMGWKKFMSYAKTSYGVDVTEEEAQAMRSRFFNLYPGLRGWHKTMREFVREHSFVRSRHGAKRNLHDIRSVDEGIRAMAERQAINSPVQRLASDIALLGAIRFHRDCDPNKAKVVAFIHDAVIVEARVQYREEVANALKFYMESTPLEKWFNARPPVAILSDVSYGPNLRDMKKMGEAKAIAPKWYQPKLDAA